GFVAWILGKLQDRIPERGRIINIIGEVYDIELKSLPKLLHPMITILQEWAISNCVQTPRVIINKHCTYCQFQKLCQDEAEREDNISLLSGITRKSFRQYE